MRTELTLRMGEPLRVESVPLTIPGFKWMQNVHATPYVSADGRVTELWIATEVTSGAMLPLGPTKSLDALTPAIRHWAKEQRIDEEKWGSMIARTLLCKKRISGK